MLRTKSYLATISLAAISLLSSEVLAVELSLENNLKQHDQGSILMVENARSIEAPKNAVEFKVLPGETKRITGGNITTFIIVRKYPRHKLKYEIVCPKDKKGTFIINPAIIHDHNLPGDCKVIRTGHWSKRSGMNWEKVAY